MRIKIKDEVYFPCRVRNYTIYKKKLRHLLRRNPNHISYVGCMNGNGKTGIIVAGEDVQRMGEFSIFYPLADINKYFYRSLER